MSATTDLQKLETKETLPTEIEKCILYCSDKQRYDVNYIDAILAATELADKDAQIAALRARVETLEWVVKRLEYIEEYPTEEMLCPICRGEKPTHYEDCELAAALNT